MSENGTRIRKGRGDINSSTSFLFTTVEGGKIYNELNL